MPACVQYAVGNKYTENIRYKYDSCGNISEITQNGHLVARYTYDSLNRLIREDNKPLEKTVLYTYDNAGNITQRCKYAFTEYSVANTGESGHDKYEYNGDKLTSYNGALCEYNNLGNPTKYRNNICVWKYGKQLTKYGDTTFAYDSLGRRTKKGDIVYTYDNDNKLIKQSNGLEFFYDASGIAAVKFKKAMYIYRKDIQGNIIAILDSTGKVVVKYEYDAWGNHTAYFLNQYDFTNVDSISESAAINLNLNYKPFFELAKWNPFRYRGYIYDTDTKLYYLQSRYYDPEVGRFISQDSVEYADPETINGLNLYAYCGNNPVMNVDPTGKSWLLLCILGGIFLSGVINGVGAVVNASEDENKWGAFFGGFVNGVISGVGVALGVATGGIFSPLIVMGTGFLGGFAGNAISQLISFGDVDLTQATYIGAVNGFVNLATFIGFRNMGVFNQVTWGERFASAISPSAVTSIISIFLFSLPIPSYKRNKKFN